MASSNLNIAPTISPEILKNISASTAINSFGTQLKDKAKEKLISGVPNAIANLNAQKDTLVAELKALGEKQKVDIEKEYKKFNAKQITKEELDARIKDIQQSIVAAQKIIELQIQKTTQDLANIINNPYDKLKKAKANFDSDIKSLKKRIQGIKIKSKKDLIKQVALNTAKTLAPIISLQLANGFVVLISQRKKLEELVEQVNVYIDTQVRDESTVAIATNLRNNAITLINNSISKLEKIKKVIDRINTIITIFNLIVLAINLAVTLLPSLTPPGLVIKFIDIINKASALTASLSVILSISTNILANEIANLIELRDSLKEISLKLDVKATNNLNDDELAALSDAFLPVGGDYGSYKGFKFAIKEEQNPQFVVKGNKRKYAVAIDRYGVEVIRSEYSFTQDPNDLIEQLKLIIDQQNLQG